MDSGAVIRHII